MVTSNIMVFMLIITSVFALTTGDLIHVIVKEGSFSDTMTVSLNSTTRRIFVFTAVSSNPFATHVWANETNHNASKEHPVVIVVEQDQDILEWSIPLIMETHRSSGSVLFNDTCRTLCNSNLLSGNFNGVQNFTVSLSTSSPDNVTVNLKVVEKTEFYLATNQSRNISTIAPGRPQQFLYKPNGTKNVGIEIKFTSNQNTCFTAAIQKIKCPVYLLGELFFLDGIRQTIISNGTIRVNGGNFANGFILVFVQEETYYLCKTENRERAIYDDLPVVTIEIKETFTHDEYIYIPLIVFSCIAAFCIVHCFVFYYLEKQQQSKLLSNNNTDSDHHQVENKVYEETNRSTGNNNIYPEEQNNQTDRHQDENEIVEETNRDHENNAINTEIENDQRANKKFWKTVDELCKNFKENKEKAHSYFSHVTNIAIFYGIPVVQLAANYQKSLNETGDEDICYYNFGCANPFWILSDFNHVQSNIGYVLLGISFMVIVYLRQRIRGEQQKGIPVYYGTDYAMPVVLISEGILSACYHICPTQKNFQFDVTFMYIMSILCVLKLYQKRHSDITLSAYWTFAILGCIELIAVLGMIFEKSQNYMMWFLVIAYILWIYFTASKIFYLRSGLTKLKEWIMSIIRESSYTQINEIAERPKRLFWTIVVFANALSLVVLIGAIVLFDVYKILDFGTFLLMLLMGNAVLYSIFYLFMKICIHKEGISLQAGIYSVLSLVLWGLALYFFFDKSTYMTSSPADSRSYNHECYVGNFYDKHDIWHFTSAVAIYFTFMFLLCLDDNIADKDRKEIYVF